MHIKVYDYEQGDCKKSNNALFLKMKIRNS